MKLESLCLLVCLGRTAARCAQGQEAQAEHGNRGWLRHDRINAGGEVRLIVVVGVADPDPGGAVADVWTVAPRGRAIIAQTADRAVSRTETGGVAHPVGGVGGHAGHAIGKLVAAAGQREIAEQAGDATLVVGVDMQEVGSAGCQRGAVGVRGGPVIAAAERGTLNIVGGRYIDGVAIVDTHIAGQDGSRAACCNHHQGGCQRGQGIAEDLVHLYAFVKNG